VDPEVAQRAEKFRALLERRREEIRNEGDIAIVNDSRGDFVEKVDEDAAPLSEMNQVIASSRNRTRTDQLQKIETALERLGEDPELFGYCEACDEEIKPRRMELMPWVTLCIKCAEARERGEDPGGRRHITDYK
jgi:DnaK suppressor protein